MNGTGPIPHPRTQPRPTPDAAGGETAARREFLRLMGASTALAGVGLTGCRRPEAHLVPYAKSAEWMIPGKPLLYATAMPRHGGAIPLVAITHDGRPTKLEGNPLVPGGGATDAAAQASVLDLYDPDRSRRVLRGGRSSTWTEFGAALASWRGLWASTGGEGLCLLSEESLSPTRLRLRRLLLERFPRAAWCEYEPLAPAPRRRLWNAALGPGRRLRAELGRADVVLALDCDALAGGDEGGTEAVAAFCARRRLAGPDAAPNRLYAVESRFTLTGAMAEHRLSCPAGAVRAAAAALSLGVAEATGDAALGTLARRIAPAGSGAPDPKWLAECARDLGEHRGRCVVLAGGRQSEPVHALVLGMNHALGNLGRTLLIEEDLERPVPDPLSLDQLAERIAGGGVRHLFILGGNPVYNAPADLAWATRQGQVEEVVRLGSHEDETSARSSWHLPAAHYLESWGDCRTRAGHYVVIQPMILPLHGGCSELELLAPLLRRGHSGRAPRALAPVQPFAPALENWTEPEPPASAADTLELVFVPDYRVDDGRGANNGWLQELPDPITKLTWDNAALVSPATARRLGLRAPSISSNLVDVIEIELAGKKLEVPALVAPGQADDSLALPIGHGRWRAGRVGNRVGVDVYPLRTRTHEYFAGGAQVRRTGRTAPLALTQEQASAEGRDLARETTWTAYAAKAKDAAHGEPEPPLSIYPHPPLDAPHQWGMVIDLNACTGCGACVVACQSENNIPIVGRDQVARGREMHWMRIDRYFVQEESPGSNARMVTQPVCCQHCELAPCETVCPVNATVHNREGLNVMAYNRCVGTRYCANNCPFKVRRFNFFDYNGRPIDRQRLGPIEADGLYLGPLAPKGMADTLCMQKNPDVTVRMRGVIEKCTFCVQRIQRARIEGRIRAGTSDSSHTGAPRPGPLQTACEQVCPAGAIAFGNLRDPTSRVAAWATRDRAYTMLESLNVRPRVRYLARVHNPNPRMPDAPRYARLEENGGNVRTGHQ